MLGARIALLRRQKKISQKELAALLGVRPSTIGMYEQGRREPDCAALVRIAELFDVSTDYLLTGRASPRDLPALEELWLAAAEKLDGQLTLRSADGQERPFEPQDLALLLAALLG